MLVSILVEEMPALHSDRDPAWKEEAERQRGGQQIPFPDLYAHAKAPTHEGTYCAHAHDAILKSEIYPVISLITFPAPPCPEAI